MSIQSYDINLGPAGSQNSTQVLEVSAQIIDFLSSNSAFDQIEVRPDFIQGSVTLKLGQGFDAGKIVNRWMVQNNGATAIAGTVVLSTAGFRNFRISGDVNVLDGSKSSTLIGAAMMAEGSKTSDAANGVGVMLANLAGSGKRLIVEAIGVQSSANNSIGYGFTQTLFSTAGNFAYAKLASGAQSVAARIYTQVMTSPGNPIMGALGVSASLTTEKRFGKPLVILPGWALELWHGVPNADIWGTFEFFEEPNT